MNANEKEKELGIILRREDFRHYEKGLWNDETLGRHLTAIVKWAFFGEDPKEEDYQATLEDKYLYCSIEETMDRISCSQRDYMDKAEKRSKAGRVGGIASGKTRAKKAAERKAAEEFQYEEDPVDDLFSTGGASKNEAKRSKTKQSFESLKQNEANEAKTKTKTTPEKGSGLTSPDHLFSGGNLNLKGGPNTGAEAGPRQEAGPALPGSAAISLDEVIRCAITNKVNLTREGCRAWLENMENSGWMIGNSRVTRKNMLKALRGFAKHFPQWNRHDGDPELSDENPQPARKKSYEELNKEFIARMDQISAAPEAGGLSICQKCPSGCKDCYKEDECSDALYTSLKKYFTQERHERFAEYLEFIDTDLSTSDYARFFIPARKLNMKTRTYCEHISNAVFPEKGTELISLSFLDDLLDAFDEEARPELEKERQELEKKRQEEEEARKKADEERKARQKAMEEARKKEDDARLASGFYLSNPAYLALELKEHMEQDDIPERPLVCYLRERFNSQKRTKTLKEAIEQQSYFEKRYDYQMAEEWSSVREWMEKRKNGFYLTDPDKLPDELKDLMEKNNVSEQQLIEKAFQTGWVNNKTIMTLEDLKRVEPEFFKGEVEDPRGRCWSDTVIDTSESA